MGLLYDLFSQEEVEHMLSIPLSMRMVADQRIWHFEHDGKFSMRSAYHVARSIGSNAAVGASRSASVNDDGRTKLLRRVWNVCVRGKVKICVWRVCLDALPTKSNLSEQRVEVDNCCSLCGCSGESIEHALRDSNMAKAVWFGGLRIRVESDNQQFVFWLSNIVEHSPASVFELSLMVIWMLWKNRNDGLWNGKQLMPQDLLIRTEGWLQEYHKCHKSGTKKSMKVQQKWRRPGVDWVKCNFDGAWIHQGSRGGFGAVLRDHMGDFVAAVAGPLGWTGSACRTLCYSTSITAGPVILPRW